MLLLGAERLQHIDYLRSDPLFCRVARLTRIPHRTNISTALKQFTSDSLKALIELNTELVIEKLRSLGIDLETSMIRIGPCNSSSELKNNYPCSRFASVRTAHSVSIFRKKIQEPRKPFQLDLFSPYNGFYEYSAVVTDTT